MVWEALQGGEAACALMLAFFFPQITRVSSIRPPARDIWMFGEHQCIQAKQEEQDELRKVRG